MHKTQVNWFAIVVLFEARHQGKPKTIDKNYNPRAKTFEESHILVKATTPTKAKVQGKKMALEKEHSYYNYYGEKVIWKFIKVIDCFAIEENKLEEGVEIYSRFILASKNETPAKVIKKYFQL